MVADLKDPAAPHGRRARLLEVPACGAVRATLRETAAGSGRGLQALCSA